ncbi:MAG: hypothetical protein R3F16_16745 [Myxococcota bacterium]|nr:hypothetical protein [Myxococcales bacterium]
MSVRFRAPEMTPIVLLLAGLLLATTGCVGGAWRQALEEDTPAAYYRFMREHGESKYAEAARERLEFHKLRRNPSLSGFAAFRKRFPDSDLVDELMPALEKPAFEAARAQGTAEAYLAFLDDFPRGAEAARARGNADYVAAGGFGGDPERLAQFAREHPESDFAAEAERTVAAVAARHAGRIDRVALVIALDETAPEARRVRQALTERIEDQAERLGVQIVPVPPQADPQAPGVPAARLEVRHVEQALAADAAGGALARPLVQGVTEVVFRDRPSGEAIAQRRFEVNVEDKAHVPGTSVLFSAAGRRFWDEFFVPLARWRNDHTIRPPIALGRPVVDVDGAGDRAIALYEDGDFDLLGLEDPMEPVTLAHYSRGEDHEKWSGVRIVGPRIALYGEEGLELVRFTPEGPVAERTFDRGQIGRVLGLAPLRDAIVIVGAKGMQWLDPETGEMRRVMRRVVHGVDAVDETLVFVDEETVYLATLDMLAEGRVIAQLKLGRTFGPNNVRVLDRTAIVTGPGGALVIDVDDPHHPKALAKLSSRSIGEILDATRVRGRTFLVGERGLQVLDPGLRRVEETVDVGPRQRVTVMGRHLVAAANDGIQVVDATPWAEGPAPAAVPGAAATESLLDGSGF